jgi:hypothetical protein
MQIPCCLPSEHFAGNLVSEAVHNFGIFWLLAWAIVIPHTSKDRYKGTSEAISASAVENLNVGITPCCTYRAPAHSQHAEKKENVSPLFPPKETLLDSIETSRVPSGKLT